VDFGLATDFVQYRSGEQANQLWRCRFTSDTPRMAPGRRRPAAKLLVTDRGFDADVHLVEEGAVARGNGDAARLRPVITQNDAPASDSACLAWGRHVMEVRQANLPSSPPNLQLPQHPEIRLHSTC
jgi:hypothetical protein